jgi:hypothetical protein
VRGARRSGRDFQSERKYRRLRWRRAGFRIYWRGRLQVPWHTKDLGCEMSLRTNFGVRRAFMVSCSSLASRSPSRRSLGKMCRRMSGVFAACGTLSRVCCQL